MGPAGTNGVSGLDWQMATNVDIANFGSDAVHCKNGKVAMGGGALPQRCR